MWMETQDATTAAFLRFQKSGDAQALAQVFDHTAAEMVRVASHLTRDLHTAAILLAGMPMMGIYPLLAMRHGHERLAAAALFGATVAAFFTLNAMLWALGHGA